MRDPLWIQSLLGLHIAAGATAFVFAPLALATRKGGKAHRRWGKVYFWAMAVVAASAIVLSAYRPILFLALVAVFSFYAAFYAYRVLGMKDLVRGGKAGRMDWMAAAITFLASLALAGFGIFRPAMVQNMGPVPVVFGVLGMSLAARRVYGFLRPPRDRMFWWYEHLQGMMGSYIAAWTAFSAVTLSRFLGSRHDLTWIVWLWPTIIGVPAISLTTAYYQRKFAGKSDRIAV
jgi:uncharacterized membrane protein